jgi:hypothetical protein
MNFYEIQFANIKKYKPTIKDSSINTYLASIKKLCKELFNSDTCSLMYFKDHASVIEYLDTIGSLSTRKNICTAIIILLKSNDLGNPVKQENLINEYSNYHKQLAVKQTDSYLDNEKTNREQSNWITQSEIESKIDKLLVKLTSLYDPSKFVGTSRNWIDTFQQYLVLNLYTKLPPIRNDFALIKIIYIENLDVNKLNHETNYINFYKITEGDRKVPKADLLLCNYKTSKTYGVKVIPLPEILVDLIHKFQVAKEKIFFRKFDTLLINTTNLQPMLKNSLTKYINKIFAPKKVSTTMIRKCYLSEKYPVIHTNLERQNDSYVMGHSVGMAQNVYIKKI